MSLLGKTADEIAAQIEVLSQDFGGAQISGVHAGGGGGAQRVAREAAEAAELARQEALRSDKEKLLEWANVLGDYPSAGVLHDVAQKIQLDTEAALDAVIEDLVKRTKALL